MPTLRRVGSIAAMPSAATLAARTVAPRGKIRQFGIGAEHVDASHRRSLDQIPRLRPQTRMVPPAAG